MKYLIFFLFPICLQAQDAYQSIDMGVRVYRYYNVKEYWAGGFDIFYEGYNPRGFSVIGEVSTMYVSGNDASFTMKYGIAFHLWETWNFRPSFVLAGRYDHLMRTPDIYLGIMTKWGERAPYEPTFRLSLGIDFFKTFYHGEWPILRVSIGMNTGWRKVDRIEAKETSFCD